MDKPKMILPEPEEIETWVNVTGYYGSYQVSSFGNVRSLERKVRTKNGFRTLTGQPIIKTVDIWGYNIVVLWKNGDSKNKKVSRLVCSAFHQNPQNKREVNHIDTVKTNDYYKNLEWNTTKENQDHAVDTGLKKSAIKVFVYDSKNKKPIGQFMSIKRASIALAFSINSIWLLLDKPKTNRKGLRFFTEPKWQQFKTSNNL